MSDKDFKVKNKLVVKGITSAGPVVSDASGNIDSTSYITTQYGGTGTSTSPSSGQILYSSSGTTYAPTTLTSLDVKGATYSDNAPSSPVVGQIWVESDSSADSFDPNIIRRQAFTSTAGQTVYTTSQTFIEGYEQVYFNGLLLLRGTDYTTSNSDTVTLSAAAAVNDIVEVVTVTNLNSVNTYTQAEINSTFAPLSNPTFTAIGGSEGGQINLAGAPSNTTLSGNINLDVYQNRVRLFEGGGNNRGAYVDLTTLSNGVGSELLASSPQSGNTGKYLVTNGTSASWQELNVAGKNKIINGDFGIWQRGTTVTAGTYTADRWVNTGGSGTVSRQAFTPGAAPVAGYESQYYLNWTITADQINNEMLQRIEDARTFAGQTVTLSFWARSTVGAQPLNVAIYQHFGTGGSPSSLAGATLISGGSPYTPTSSWQRFTFTFTVPSVSGKTFGTDNNSFLWVRPAQFTTTATNTSLDIWGVQLEAGSVATPFSISTPNKQSELAACQRYYQVLGDNIYELIYGGYMTSGTTAYISFPYPVTMRATPTGTIVGNWAIFNTGQPIIQSTHPKSISLRVASTTTGQFYFHSNTTYYLTMSAEL